MTVVCFIKNKQDMDDPEIVSLKPLHIDTERTPFPTCLVVGKRFSGKSTMGTSIAYIFSSYITRWASWCKTRDTQHYWAKRLGTNASVYGVSDEDIRKLEVILQDQDKRVLVYEKLGKPLPSKYYLGFIFDDVTATKAFAKSAIVSDLFSNGRHYHAVIIITCQYINQIPPECRMNVDFLFMLFNGKKTIHILFDEYINDINNRTIFAMLLMAVTCQRDSQNNLLYNALVQDNTRGGRTLDEVMFVYRSPKDFKPDQVRLCSDMFIKYCEKHFHDEETERYMREFIRKQRKKRLRQYRQRTERKRMALNQNDQFDQLPDIDDFGDEDIDWDDQSYEKWAECPEKNKKKTESLRLQHRKSCMQLTLPPSNFDFGHVHQTHENIDDQKQHISQNQNQNQNQIATDLFIQQQHQQQQLQHQQHQQQQLQHQQHQQQQLQHQQHQQIRQQQYGDYSPVQLQQNDHLDHGQNDHLDHGQNYHRQQSSQHEDQSMSRYQKNDISEYLVHTQKYQQQQQQQQQHNVHRVGTQHSGTDHAGTQHSGTDHTEQNFFLPQQHGHNQQVQVQDCSQMYSHKTHHDTKSEDYSHMYTASETAWADRQQKNRQILL
jgi:hypothetical protein